MMVELLVSIEKNPGEVVITEGSEGDTMYIVAGELCVKIYWSLVYNTPMITNLCMSLSQLCNMLISGSCHWQCLHLFHVRETVHFIKKSIGMLYKQVW